MNRSIRETQLLVVARKSDLTIQEAIALPATVAAFAKASGYSQDKILNCALHDIDMQKEIKRVCIAGASAL